MKLKEKDILSFMKKSHKPSILSSVFRLILILLIILGVIYFLNRELFNKIIDYIINLKNIF